MPLIRVRYHAIQSYTVTSIERRPTGDAMTREKPTHMV